MKQIIDANKFFQQVKATPLDIQNTIDNKKQLENPIFDIA